MGPLRSLRLSRGHQAPHLQAAVGHGRPPRPEDSRGAPAWRVPGPSGGGGGPVRPGMLGPGVWAKLARPWACPGQEQPSPQTWGRTLALAGCPPQALREDWSPEMRRVAVTGTHRPMPAPTWPVPNTYPNYHPWLDSSAPTNMNNQNEINGSSMWPCFGEHLLMNNLPKRRPTAVRE